MIALFMVLFLLLLLLLLLHHHHPTQNVLNAKLLIQLGTDVGAFRIQFVDDVHHLQQRRVMRIVVKVINQDPVLGIGQEADRVVVDQDGALGLVYAVGCCDAIQILDERRFVVGRQMEVAGIAVPCLSEDRLMWIELLQDELGVDGQGGRVQVRFVRLRHLAQKVVQVRAFVHNADALWQLDLERVDW